MSHRGRRFRIKGGGAPHANVSARSSCCCRSSALCTWTRTITGSRRDYRHRMPRHRGEHPLRRRCSHPVRRLPELDGGRPDRNRRLGGQDRWKVRRVPHLSRRSPVESTDVRVRQGAKRAGSRRLGVGRPIANLPGDAVPVPLLAGGAGPAGAGSRLRSIHRPADPRLSAFPMREHLSRPPGKLTPSRPRVYCRRLHTRNQSRSTSIRDSAARLRA